MEFVYSKNGVQIRLTEERWVHIIEEHTEMAGYYYEVLEAITDPQSIYQGIKGEYIAIKPIEKGKYIVVIYREIDKGDGFIITAFLTKREKQFEKRVKIWP